MRHLAEYVLARLVLAAVDRMPLRVAGGLISRLGDLWWHLDRRRQRVAVSNILRSGIARDAGEARAIGRASLHHFGRVLIESLKSGEIFAEDSPGGVDLAIAPDVLEVLEDPGRGLIMASGHFGNWEVAAQVLSRFKPVAGITRPMNNPRVEELVQRRKPRHRFHIIPKYAADPRRFLEVLEQGEILALLMDQHAHTKAARVEFFGHPAATHTTAAMLHLVTRAPLCFGACRRTAPGRFELTTSPLIEHRPSGKKKDDVVAILSTLNRHLEDAIRRDPDQYLWSHRRWRDPS